MRSVVFLHAVLSLFVFSFQVTSYRHPTWYLHNCHDDCARHPGRLLTTLCCACAQMASTHIGFGGGVEVNAMGRAKTAESLAEDKWFLGYYEFIDICLHEHARQRVCRWQAAWNQWQVTMSHSQSRALHHGV